ncbi:Hsp33 family molecular chaperone HslO [Oceanirhabdus sp. W0125-5]|uniref:Hsp33 family molecular chaperone HslO n=1 Tax=Oceanirhabdus sp. W0125-5 TaxID=2999116 RepID=UPI0022F33697|nr:Hsp33 family molecular chaperone HslO [Oceanirhabdus sp. W0125-5]WBW99400.1 Hsp33 family molecular chaperone HslO [Oceanirhabdus sp. W0125-5]
MQDKLIRAIAHNGDIRVIGAQTTNLVNEGISIHKCAPTAAAALGRMLTAGVLMGSTLKSEKDKLTLKMDGGGIAKGVIVTASSDCKVKGYIGNPDAHLPANDKGKLDVSGIIGKDGSLVVIRDMGLKKPYVGQIPIYTGEIGDDIAYYYTTSEQTPSAVGLGVLVEPNYTVSAAGGFIIQMMPGASEMVADILMYRLEEIPSITQMLSEGKTIEDILKLIFEDMNLQILEEEKPEYKCDCSRDKVEKALISIGKEELQNIVDENKVEEIACQFCSTRYEFTPEDIKKLIAEI